jgi:hypothetical protein
MNELRPENLEPLSQFFDLMLNVFFYGGSFMETVTDVNVHEHLKLAKKRSKPVLSVQIVHPVLRWKRAI